MKLSHGQLESFRRDPRAFISQQSAPRFGGMSMFRVWQYSLKHLHANNTQDAVDYLRQSVHAHFKVNKANNARLEGMVEQLHIYEKSFNELGHVAIHVLRAIKLEISPKLTIGGELARLDLALAGGYAAYVLIREPEEQWQEQLRFPLIQSHLAKELKCALGQVAVGVYFVQTGIHLKRKYSASRVKAAMDEAITLAAQVP